MQMIMMEWTTKSMIYTAKIYFQIVIIVGFKPRSQTSVYIPPY